MRALALGFFLAASSGAAMPAEPSIKIRVLARVAGHIVTDRQVQIDAILEDPGLYAPGARAKYITKEAFDQSFQRVLAQTMASEENRILGQTQVTEAETEESMAALRKSLDTNWKRFLQDFDLTESDLKPILADKIILRRALAARVKSATAKKDPNAKPLSREAQAQASIDEWLKQLRSRYRVQLFKEDVDAVAR